MPQSRELSVQECEELLRAGTAGRVAVSTPNGPHIVPVNYTVVDQAIILRTSPYSVLGTYGRDTMIAFEIDLLDRENQRGWSVLARGRVQTVTDRHELDHIREISEPAPWASGARSLHLRLRWTELSGRKLGGSWDPLAQIRVVNPG